MQQRPHGRLERLAVERWRRFAANEAYYYDAEAAERVCEIFSLLRHTSGSYYRKNFRLLPWQQFVLRWIFGWKYKESGRRVTRKCYVEVAKKNGKSELAGALGLYGAFFDGEAGAECYSAANKYDQATICWAAGKVMAKLLKEDFPEFDDECKIYDSITTRQIKNLTNESFFKPIAADSRTLDGVRPHFAIIDEYHEAKDDSVLRNLSSGMVNRTQPLLFIITTAGFNINGPCHRYRKVVADILEGKKDDDSTFGLIFTAGEEDDWHQEHTWHKSNPSLGATPTLEGLQTEYTKALNEGSSAEVNFKTKNLNMWVRQSKTWIPDRVWMKGSKPIDLPTLEGRKCYMAMDLSSNRDLTAVGLLFPPDTIAGEEEEFVFLCDFWCPREGAEQRARKDQVPYLDWAAAGLLHLTEGDFIDYDEIRAHILAMADRYAVQGILFDPWQSNQLAMQLQQEGANVIQFKQRPSITNEPIQRLEKMVGEGVLVHGGDPILRWMAGNVTLKISSDGLVKLDKNRSREKIDGIVVMMMCVAAWLDAEGRDQVNAEDMVTFI